MMTLTNVRFVVLACIALAGCSRSVLLDRAIATAPAGEARVMRLYYDRDGDLYPGQLLHVDGFMTDDRFAKDATMGSTFRAGMERGAPGPWRDVVDSLHLARSAAPAELWARVQDSLVARAATRLRQLTSPGAGGTRTLVVLAHGFNNNAEGAGKNYAALRRMIDSGYVDAARTVYLDLHWDGLENVIGIPVWGKAQNNFPLVGLAFRRVLRAAPADVPIRILTHSTGGPLISNTLWDASVPMSGARDSDWPAYRRYFAHLANPDTTWAPPRQRDIRVGMIVPAMPGATFANVQASDLGVRRLVIGVNPADLAITKIFLGCRADGSTCLSKEPNEFCTARHRFESDLSVLRLINFSTPREHPAWQGLWLRDSHDLVDYLRREDMPRFLRMVFDPAARDPGEELDWCRDALREGSWR